MSLTAVYNALLRHLQTYACTGIASETLTQGEVVKTPAAPVTLRLAVLPMTARDVQYQEAGAYTLQDVNAYEIGAQTMARGWTFSYKSSTYVVEDSKNYLTEGNFVRYLCRRVQ